MLNVLDCWLSSDLFDSQFEFAVRSWALQSDEVSDKIQDVDAARIGALTKLLVRFGYRECIADVRARTVYLVQIGYISMKAKEDVAVRMKRIPDYVEIFTGQAPTAGELARFHARHKFKPQESRADQSGDGK